MFFAIFFILFFMFNFLRNIFGFGVKTNFAQLLINGAIIIDVRSKGEFDGGNIKSSINIPLDQLNKNLSLLKDKNNPIILCCASGMRSGMAKKMLQSHGYLQVYNGGSWSSLQNKL
jgi:phage shock protein E